MKKILVIVLLLVLISLNVVHSQVGNRNSLSLVIDYSNSMRGEKLESALNSAVMLVDLLDLWKDLYPDRIGNMRFQYIKFATDAKEMYKMNNVQDYNALKKMFKDDYTTMGDTDYRKALNMAVKNIANCDNKTIFLTDGEDRSEGPDKKVDYSALGETKFILYNSKASVKQWEDVIRCTSRVDAVNEYDIGAHFVSTLFSYVDDINKYLIRRGEVLIGKFNNKFELQKHNDNGKSIWIIVKPYPEMKISSINNEQGEILSAKDYKLYDKSTFFQINFDDNIKKGKYYISFANVKNNFGSKNFYYISFEKTDIGLRVNTDPEKDVFLADSNVNFNLEFYDKKTGEAIRYRDFLGFSAFRLDFVNKNSTSILGYDKKLMNFTRSFKANDRTVVKGAWNYNAWKLSNDKNLEVLKTFNVDKKGVLFSLVFNKDELWEGRSLKMRLFPLGQSIGLAQEETIRIKLTNIETNNTNIINTSANGQSFEAEVPHLKAGDYQISLDNERPDVLYAIDQGSETQIHVEKRTIVVSMMVPEYSVPRNNSFFGKIGYYLRSLIGKTSRKISVDYEVMKDKPVRVEYRLPYKKSLDIEVPIKLRFNKVFQDEDGNIFTQYSDDARITDDKGRELLKASFSGETSFSVKDLEQDSIFLHIFKEKGRYTFTDEMNIQPFIKLSGEIFSENGGSVYIDDSDLVFQLVTSKRDKISSIIVGGIVWIFITLTSLLVLLFIIGRYVHYQTLLREKNELWDKCCQLSVEDLFKEFPDQVKVQLEEYIKTAMTSEIFKTEEPGPIKLYRAFKILKQDEKFKKVVFKHCSLKFLNSVLSRLKGIEPEKLNGFMREFYMGSGIGTVLIRGTMADTNQETETVFRTRFIPPEDYGSLSVNKGKIVYSPGKMQCFINDSFVPVMSNIKEVVIQSGDKLQFGYSQSGIKFKLQIFLIDNILSITKII